MSTNKGFSSALRQAQGGRIGAPPAPERPDGHSDTQAPERPGGQAVGHSDVQTPKRLEVQTPTEAARIPRTLYLPPELARWLKLHAARTGREMSEIVTEALEQYRRREDG